MIATNPHDKIFITIRSGVTCWVPSHLPTPDDVRRPNKVIMLGNITPSEELVAMMIYFYAIDIVDDAAIAATIPHAKTPAEVINRVTEFRTTCARDPHELLRCRYNPQAAALAIEAERLQQELRRQKEQLEKDGADPQHQHQQEQQQQQQAGGVTDGSAPAASDAGILPTPFGAAHHAATGVPPPRALPPPLPLRYYVEAPDTIPTPTDVSRADIDNFLQCNRDLVFGCFQSTGLVYWLKDYRQTLNPHRRFMFLRRHTTFFMNPDMRELNMMTPVRIHEQPICTFFVAKGMCRRNVGCAALHVTEDQLRLMIAATAVRHSRLPEAEQRRVEREFLDLHKPPGYEDFGRAGPAGGGGAGGADGGAGAAADPHRAASESSDDSSSFFSSSSSSGSSSSSSSRSGSASPSESGSSSSSDDAEGIEGGAVVELPALPSAVSTAEAIVAAAVEIKKNASKLQSSSTSSSSSDEKDSDDDDITGAVRKEAEARRAVEATIEDVTEVLKKKRATRSSSSSSSSSLLSSSSDDEKDPPTDKLAKKRDKKE